MWERGSVGGGSVGGWGLIHGRWGRRGRVPFLGSWFEEQSLATVSPFCISFGDEWMRDEG